MRILITNDDGINAPGLVTLERIAAQLAGPDGEVWTVAPAFEQSGVGHCISYTKPMMIAELAPRRFAAEGSPADCVLAGLHDVMTDSPPDLVLSGVNRGNNSAENTLYSGTIGGAMEAALQGVPAVALSQFFGPGNADLDDPFSSAAGYGAECITKLIKAGLLGKPADKSTYSVFYSINFPPFSAEKTLGLRATRQGLRQETSFGVQAQTAPNGRRFLWITGGPQHEPTGPGTDAQANLDGYVSITPMRADLTAHDAVDALQGHLS